VTRRAAGAAATLAAAGAWIAYAWLPHLRTSRAVWRGGNGAPRIALTFDDGPDPRWTPAILDILAAREVRGSFFLIGERARRAPGVVRAIRDAGHEIGNHSWSHRSLWLCGPSRTRLEIVRAHDLLADLSGEAPRLFRPPWGMVNAALPAALRACGERAVFWSIQPEGLRPVSAPRQVERILGAAHPGAIVDLHDAEGTAGAPSRLAAVLPAAIDGLRAAGFTFATVGDLLAEERPEATVRPCGVDA
jgi:peptidoglycan/xylan/chitin deacetylase (PgdA/CDA1 family)